MWAFTYRPVYWCNLKGFLGNVVLATPRCCQRAKLHLLEEISGDVNIVINIMLCLCVCISVFGVFSSSKKTLKTSSQETKSQNPKSVSLPSVCLPVFPFSFFSWRYESESFPSLSLSVCLSSGFSSCSFPLSALAVSALQALQGEAEAQHPLPPR